MTRRGMLERDGYIVVQNVLSAAEVGRLRETLLTHFSQQWMPVYLGKHQHGAAVEIPGISWIFRHPHIPRNLSRTLRDAVGSVYWQL